MALNRNFDQDLRQLGISRQFVSPQPVPTDRLQVERLTNPLDGSPLMNVDGSVIPVSFRAPIPPTFNALVLEAHFFIQDRNMNPGLFGGLVSGPLTNGCRLTFRDGADDQLDVGGNAVTSVIGENNTYKKNSDWSVAVGTNFQFWGSSTEDLLAFDFPWHELGISIQLTENEYLEMLIQDDLTGLSDFQGALTTRLVGM